MKKHLVVISIYLLLSSLIFATPTFSGYAGGKIHYSANPDKEEYDPDLTLQAFFTSQFNITQNVWSHLEFSLNTGDLLGQSLFHETDSKFQIDELSLIARANLRDFSNYFSVFMGTYDPIGSDIFLQRYFNIIPISSKITDSYMGLSGSILYPHFGVGIADIVKVHSFPLALGPYIYVNHEDSKYYVLNTDFRAATVMQYFTCDLALGIGIPLADKYRGEDVIIAVDKVYWHAGTTILLGNNFTNSIFFQAGIYNASFSAKNTSSIVAPQDIYLLLEPRLIIGNAHLHISLYSLPPDTVKKLLFIEDTLGLNVNAFFTTSVKGINTLTCGIHTSFGIVDKTFYDFKDIKDFAFDEKSYNLNFSPYINASFLAGELHFQGTFRFMEMLRGHMNKAISLDFGYRTKL